MERLAYFFIDDVIWTFRDIAKDRPKSIFDNAFMAALKKPHDLYGMTVQLNLFYRTDFFYGSKEFTLSDFPDCYKSEFEANSDWLKLAFHAKQEFPDYPYINADYDDVVYDFKLIQNEVYRFAGEKSWSCAVVPHWLPISKDGCKALFDCGIKFLSPSSGPRTEFKGDYLTADHSCLPYGHSFRVLQNRKPETMLYTRLSKNTAISRSACAYNHVSEEVRQSFYGKNTSVLDEETGMRFRQLGGGPTLNLHEVEELKPAYDKQIGNEFIGTGNHEQYFYKDYYAYQPTYADKIMEMAKIMHENGYRYITADDFR